MAGRRYHAHDSGSSVALYFSASDNTDPRTNGRTYTFTFGGGIADATRLAQLGITHEERTELAVKFAVGKELWRVVVDHFTPWDYNWPKVPEAGSRYPNLKSPKNPNGLVPDCDE